MGLPMGLAITGSASSVAGDKFAGLLAKASGGDSATAAEPQFKTPGFVNQINKLLLDAQNSALATNRQSTNVAIGTQNTFNDRALTALNSALTNATNQANLNTQFGFQQSQALQAPYAASGYSANDAYLDSLGLKRPAQGSQSIAQSLDKSAQANNILNQYAAAGGDISKYLDAVNASNKASPDGGAGGIPTGNYVDPMVGLTAPTAPKNVGPFSDYTSQVTQQQINDYIKGHTNPVRLFNGQEVTGKGKSVAGLSYTGNGPQTYFYGGDVSQAYGTPSIIDGAKQYLGNQLFQNAIQAYDSQNTTYQAALKPYNAAKQQLTQLGITPQQLQTATNYNKGLFS